ncbi:hypothetical protein IE987_26615 [Klebsiella pneumoniae]|uniref:Uncharacterized protein n=1 Tax=Klebsiella pneumoniae TaxID=573 RepID=A0A927HP37_KLEPN|nr:hypothetical protein [Klebsiella pneumoniae]
MAGGAADADRRDWLPERTPIVYDGDEKSYQGINADYLALMAHSLGLKVIIRQYDTEQQALTARPTAGGYPAHSGGAPGCARPGPRINPRRCLKTPADAGHLAEIPLCRR